MSDIAKRNAAIEALKLVEDGMTLGLGTGSTAAFFVEELGKKVQLGLDVICVSTSEVTEAQARSLNIPMADLDTAPTIHLTIDGADEFDPELRLIKGGGAALLREKIIADSSDMMVVITDASKQVAQLGAFPLPVEVNPFGMALTKARIEETLEILGMYGIHVNVRLNEGGGPLLTDGGHHILDLHCKAIPDPDMLGAVLDQIPGVVEHGLFLDIADAVIIGTETGAETIAREE
ncbi:ribose-5-phosphate isomerase RpiA [Hirschia baltica]|uniref:Ribose-5-phosphate isomerase A n=1 Tax=Hirschia baltica (strain ATCC 49814 / DSM 5838 / IFAM 1418) TaxID=582402 RepID=C6XK92_HIRBI|nr:ribose-5-phosphate isomerase RpiA [Hirschia baltica]ACT59537.1 ribose 5-phosphate isomerase [Hirschia baltica ATCC 49814]